MDNVSSSMLAQGHRKVVLQQVTPYSCQMYTILRRRYRSMSSFLRGILKDATLSEVKGVWTLFWKGCEYIGLLDARSKKDAEQQIAEMLFVRGPHAPAASTAASCPAECPAQTSWPARADLQ